MTYHIGPPAPHSHYFTVALNRPGDDLLVLEIERLRQAVRLTRAKRPFRIAAWVVMPDHLHTIWTLPAGEDDVVGRWRLIKARFSTSLPHGARKSRTSRTDQSVWQRGFWQHRIGDAADMALHMRSCQMDPVRHGLVDVPEAWPYSSFRASAALERVG
ncbi:REP-associated tyrosine transposase [Cypionkella psychrotolerans]|uniref:REP-associated tyrosine transposase n=1 Tax=Cypionkella psychrotolerans TaxID=1678131 RepID=UPI0006B5206C|nr:transposase [Cypionkella psychrotolerans]